MNVKKLQLMLMITIACLSVNAFATTIVNHALDASVTADSEFSGQFKAQFVADGVIPGLRKRNSGGKEWAVNGATHRNGAEITMQWQSPVSVTEIVYYGRSSYKVECWRGYEIRVEVDEAGTRRLMAWMDINVPYYSDSKSNYTDRMGCRRLLPPKLGRVLADVGKRRCASCHKGGKIPRKFYTRITNVEENDFLLAPLAKIAGGTQACGTAVFKDKNDPDYQKILAEFAPITKMIKDTPRLDMPGAIIKCVKSE
jgi:hypothetical protein